jgi:hypothetical protein
MNQRFPLTLPQPLIAEWTRYCANRFPDGPFKPATLAAIHTQLPGFNNKILSVSSFTDYLRLISFVYAKDNRQVFISFNDTELDMLRAVTNTYAMERSKTYSLFLCSFMFASGKFSIPVEDFLSYFSLNKSDYGYQLLITGDIHKLYADTNREYGRLPLTAIIRAAHFYYRNIDPGKLRVTESREVTVTNSSTGWKKFYIRGSFEFKNYLFDLKQETGKTINCIVNNAAFQFLSSMRGALYEK